MSSTKEDPHQPSAKYAPPKHAPEKTPTTPAPSHGRSTATSVRGKASRRLAGNRSHGHKQPTALAVADPRPGRIGRVGTAWYHATHPAVDDGHLILQGNIDVRQVNLAFKVEGRIATLEVDEGDTVAAGETVATLDRQYFEDDLRAVKARRDSAQATLEELETGRGLKRSPAPRPNLWNERRP